MLPLTLLLLASPALASTAPQGTPVPQSWLAPPAIEYSTLFEGGRFPCITTHTDGTLLASWGSSKLELRRSADGGASWGPVVSIDPAGIQGGGLTVDAGTGDVLAFCEAGHPPSELTVWRSQDCGETWAESPTRLLPNSLGHVHSMHMNESGITLRYGEHAGRLVRPTRWYAGDNDRSRWHEHYTGAMYSDDGGHTWQTAEPFPEKGTGEAAIVELSDGTLYYNSRVHWPEAERETRRRSAISDDGGRTWKDWRVIPELPDGRQDRSYGCMGGLARLPLPDRDLLVFSNLDTPKAVRERLTIWLSMDGGRTWPVKRLLEEGSSAYSSLTVGLPGTPGEGWIHAQYEAGGGCKVARFNLAWLLEESGGLERLESGR